MATGAPLVVSEATGEADVAEGQANTATLFAGISFFLVQRLPSRSQLIRDIEANGGCVVKLEKQADYVIADHARTDAPTGSYSWKLITTALSNGAMPDNLSDFPAGPRPGTVRDVGSGMPAKAGRTPFTLADDQELWKWVEHEKARAGMVKGNDIYKRLEQVNPRHTFQAWRDRYIKKLINNPPAGVELAVSAESPPTPAPAEDTPGMSEDFPTPPAKRRKLQAADGEQDTVEVDRADGPARDTDSVKERNHRLDESQPENGRDSGEDNDTDLDEVHIGLLLDQALEIEDIAEDRRDEAWKAFSLAYPHRDAAQWQAFWLERVRPLHQAQAEAQKVRRRSSEDYVPDESAPNKRKRGLSTQSTSDGPHELGPPQSDSIDQMTLGVANGQQLASDSSTAGNGGQRESEHDITSAELPTSDANRAAEKQIIEEVSDSHRASADPELTGTGLDQVFDSQHEHENRQRSPQSSASPASGEIGELGSRDSFVSDEDPSHGRLSMRSTPSDGARNQHETNLESGTALTEANLAAQNKKPVLRGADLPEEDPAKDQSDFVRFLQDALIGTNTLEDAATPQDSSLLQHVDERTSASAHSSEDDIDDVLRTNLEWPSSPQQPMSMSSGSLAAGRAATGRQELLTEMHHDLDQLHVDQTEESPADQRDDTSLNGRHYDAESEHDVDLTIALPDVGGGFDSSSDHFDSQIMSNSSATAVKYTASTNGDQSHDYQMTPTAVDIIEISSASPPSSSIDSPMSSGDSHSQDQYSPARTRRLLETQDIFGAETQDPDLFVPLPPDSDDASEDEEHDTIHEPGLDLSMPLPPDSDESSGYEEQDTTHELEQPRRGADNVSATALDETETPPAATGPDEGTILESWILTMGVRGYEEDLSIQALKCTSMRLDLAELVLVYMKSGKGIPVDVPGIWDDEEDRQLQGGDASLIQRLEAKHGWDACKARLEFLEEYHGDE